MCYAFRVRKSTMKITLVAELSSSSLQHFFLLESVAVLFNIIA